MFLAFLGTKTKNSMKDCLKRIKLISVVNKSNLSRKDKNQIIKILLTYKLEKGLPLILPILGVVEEVIRLFSQ